MSLPALEDIQQDDLALAVAPALRVANHTAAAEGVPLDESLVTTLKSLRLRTVSGASTTARASIILDWEAISLC